MLNWSFTEWTHFQYKINDIYFMTTSSKAVNLNYIWSWRNSTLTENTFSWIEWIYIYMGECSRVFLYVKDKKNIRSNVVSSNFEYKCAHIWHWRFMILNHLLNNTQIPDRTWNWAAKVDLLLLICVYVCVCVFTFKLKIQSIKSICLL